MNFVKFHEFCNSIRLVAFFIKQKGCQSIYRISDYTRSFIKDESPMCLQPVTPLSGLAH